MSSKIFPYALIVTTIMLLASCGKRGGDFGTIHEAYESGDQSNVRAFVIENPSAIDDVDEHGNTVLFLSIYDQYDQLAMNLIDSGAEINLINQVNVSPLQMACMNKNHALVKYLIDNGADPNLQNGSALISAIQVGRLDICKLLLSAGSDPALKSDAGMNAFEHAKKEGNTDIIELLSQYGNSDTRSE